VGFERVICGLSGGVDSAVTAVLIHEAIGEQLTCIFVDHGLMRLNEADEVVKLFREAYNIRSSMWMRPACSSMRWRASPTRSRSARPSASCSSTCSRPKQEDRRAAFLAQGTLYPDVIESVSFTGGPSVTIKSHHNVGGLPERMNMKLVEPLRELFKDEVRLLGQELGLPAHFVGRHPFPGPGLAIRIPHDDVTEEKLDILRKADAIYLDEIRKAGLYDAIWQAFAVLLPVRTVGVMGDGRTYDRCWACAP
jgi:GMP synthase (glutamine-hydrolysing)